MQDKFANQTTGRSHSGWLAALAATAATIMLGAAPGSAQPVDCNILRAQIASAPARIDPRAAAAARRQRAELDRTAVYAEQLGCQRRQFLFFGSPPPPQCAQIDARMARMRANLDRLQNAMDRGTGARNALVARYNQYCTQRAAAPRGFFEQLFGGGPDDGGVEEFVQPDPTGPRRGSKAVCVRTCDGYFFPVSYNAFGQSPDRLEDLCRAQCPYVDTEVFTYSPSRDITEAVSVNGTPYSSLANALKYRRTFDAACTCRPPGKSWAETLAPAERLISGRSRDLIVTPEKAEELSRPRQSPPSRGPATLVPGRQTSAPASGVANAQPEIEQVADRANVPADEIRRVRRVGPAL